MNIHMPNGKYIARLALVPLSLLLFAATWFYIKPALSDDSQVVGAETLTIEDDAVLWELTNTGNSDAVIERIEITWPGQYGNLRQIVFNGKIYDGGLLPTSATITEAILGKKKHRTLKKGKSRELHFKFEKMFLAATQSQIQVNVNFNNGLLVELSESLNPLVGELEVTKVLPGNSPLDSLPGISTQIDEDTVLYLLTENENEGLRITADTGGLDLPSMLGNTYFKFQDTVGYRELYVVLETDQSIKHILGCSDSSESCSLTPTSQITDDRIMFIPYPDIEYAISTRVLIETN